MEYYGKTWNRRVRIIATSGWLKEYSGQTCDATFYDGAMPHIDTEQLTPPMPRWQSAKSADLEVIPDDRHV